MMKKLLSTILIIAMLIPTAVFAETESVETIGYDNNQEQIEFLITAGFIDGKENKADYDMEMTAKEFRTLLLNLGITDEQLREIDAFGIDYTSKSNVTRTDAAVPLVKMLGYDVWAINQGGYPDGYINIADSNGYFKGVTAKGDEPLSRADAYRMVFNAINSPIYPDILYPGENFINEEETYLTEKLSIYSIEGIVTSTAKNALPGYTTSIKDMFTVGNMKIISDGKNIESYFATRVKAWCKYDEAEEDYTLLTINYHKKNNSMEIKAQDIINYSNYVYQYYDHEKGDYDREKISSSINIVYNGVGITVSNASIVRMKPANGSIVLVDNNGDSIWDVLMINDYDIACVDEVRAQDNIIITKDIQSFTKQNLDFDNIDIYDAKGNKDDISSLYEWNILSLAKDGNGGYLYAVVSKASVTGSVRSSNRENSSLEFELKDGNKYYVANGFIPAGTIISSLFPQSDEYTFFLSSDGTIAGYKLLPNSSYYVAYLADVDYYIDENTDEPALRIKAYDISSESGVTMFAAEKCRLEGTRTALNLIDDALTDNDGYALDTLFRYKLNSNQEVIDIDLPENNNMSFEPNSVGGLVKLIDAPVITYVTDDKGTPETSDDEQVPTQRRTAWMRDGSVIIRDTGFTDNKGTSDTSDDIQVPGRGWIEGIPYTNDCIKLVVPANRENLEDYYISTKDKDTQLVYEAYRVEGETKISSIIVELGATGIPDRDTNTGFTNNTALITDDAELYLVKDLTYEWSDIDDEAMYSLTLLGSKGEFVYKAKSPELVTSLNISKGSVIRYALDSSDRIVAADVRLNSTNLQAGDSWYTYEHSLATSRAMFGLAYKKYDETIAIALKNPNGQLYWNDIVYLNTEAGAKVYVYDVDKAEVKEGTIADIDASSSVGVRRASRVFYYSKTGAGKMMVIYKGLEN